MSYNYTNRSFRRYQKPVEVGKEYKAEIIELSHSGDAGVARLKLLSSSFPTLKRATT